MECKKFWIISPSAKVAFILSDERIVTYRDLHDDVEAFRQRLKARRGIILIHCDGSYLQYVAYLAALNEACPVILQKPDSEKCQTSFSLSYEFFPSADRLDAHKPDAGIELHTDLALILSTSGSTGDAKSVRLSFDNLSSNANAISDYLELSSAERAPLALPFQYSYGISIVNSHLLAGGTLVQVPGSVMDDEFWDFFRRTKCTSLAGVPHTFDLIDQKGVDTGTLTQLRYMTQAGGRMTADNVTKWSMRSQSEGWRFFVMYGQTEAAPRVSYLPPDLAPEFPQCIGKAIPGGHLSICGEEGEPLPDGEPGELVYQGPNTMMGYARTDADLRLGQGTDVLHTGDMAKKHSNGLFEIVGRKARFAKLFGMRVSLDGVERKLAEDGVKATCSSDDATFSILVERTAGTDIEVIRALVSSWLSIPAFSFEVFEVDELPRNENGKIDANRVKQVIAQQRTLDVTTEPTHELVGETTSEPKAEPGELSATERRIAAAWKKVVGPINIREGDSFYDVGGDSLSAVQIGLVMGKEFDRTVVRATLEGQALRDIAVLQNTEVAPFAAKLPERTARTWAINVTRGLMVLAVLFSHWGPGFSKRLGIGEQADYFLGWIYVMGTEGFAVIFGIGLSIFFLPGYVENKPAVWKRLRRSFWLVLSGLTIMASFHLIHFALRGEAINGLNISLSFYNILAYYVLALLTARFWLDYLSSGNNVMFRALVVCALAMPLYWLASAFEPGRLNSILEWPRLMAVAGYSYFKVSGFVFAGIAAGYWYGQQKDTHRASRIFALGGFFGMAFTMIVGLDVLPNAPFATRGSPFFTSLLGFVFYFFLVIFLVGAFESLLRGWMELGRTKRGIMQVLIVIGGLALPIFAFHGVVIPAKDILELLGLPGAIALLIPLSTFLFLMAYFGWRLWRMYFG